MPIEDAIKTFENYPSILKTKSNISLTKNSFAFVNIDDITKGIIGILDVSKSSVKWSDLVH